MAGREQSSGFFFNVQQWRASRSVQRMSFTERGVYLEMLFEAWEQKSLPDDPQAVADALATTPQQVADVLAAWETVRRNFVAIPRGRSPMNNPNQGCRSYMYNIRLEQTRRDQIAYRRRREEAGQRGGKAKASKHRQQKELQSSNATANPSNATANSSIARRSASNAVANSSDLIRSDLIRSDLIRREKKSADAAAVPTVVDHRSKRPIYQSDRFVVFEWQLDEFDKILGPHLDAFNLHQFFDDLSKRSREAGLVIPGGREVRWQWLQAQVLAEAQRRGLPIASTSSSPAPTYWTLADCPHDPKCGSASKCDIQARILAGRAARA